MPNTHASHSWFTHLPSQWQQPLQECAQFIVNQQQSDGAIPWYTGHHLDPWCHVEAIMGLTLAGCYPQAEQGFAWLAQQQCDDGSWYAAYEGNQPKDLNHRETNFTAYIATGVWHYYCCTNDSAALTRWFPMVEAAINWVLHYQAASGEIYWAVDQHHQAKADALITACSSIYKSLGCAIQIAEVLQQPKPQWQQAQQALHDALLHKPDCFDRSWASKSRYSMDWFYPILAGLFTRPQAQQRLQQRWQEFVEPKVGCRCVSDEPWVTTAESCELIMALVACGKHEQGLAIFNDIQTLRHPSNGGYWTGYNFRDDNLWPLETTTWTAAAILLAADALFNISPAATLFTQLKSSE